MGKKYLLVLSMLAALIIGVLVSGQAAVTNGDARYNLEGYSRERGKWTRGELKGWLEDNWVPYRLSMASVVPGNFEITIQHDYQWTGSGGPDPGVDVCKSEPGYPLYGEPLFWDEPTSTNFWVGYENGTPLPIIVTTVRIGDFIKPNTIVIQYKSNFSVPSTYGGQNLYLYWMAHLAIGSSGWSGASLHAHTTATGNQDVPIAIPPSNMIYGYKFYDYNANGIWDNDDYGIENWTIYLKGSYLGQLISREMQTDATGRYEFRGLPDGTWNITEEVRTGWIPITPSTYTVTVRRGQVKGPYNFGNVQLEPDIDVTKVANVEKVHVGETITYEYTLTNTGNCPLYNVLVVDDNGTPGDVSDDITLYSNGLTKGQVKTFTHQRIVTASDADPLVNVVTAEGYDELGRNVTDSASESVDILHPAIEVTKVADVHEVHVGDKITYTITVENAGDCPLYNVLVKDLTLNWSVTISGPFTGSESWSVEHWVASTDPDPYENTVTAEGYDILGMKVDDSDPESVDIIIPLIDIVKSGAEFAHVNDTITYTYEVTNPNDCELSDVTVVDDVAGSATYVGGDADMDGKLDPGETWTFEASYKILPTDLDPLVNNATASGIDPLGLTVTAKDSWSVDILHPRINVVKSGPHFAHELDGITYKYTVKNLGDCELSDVTVIDDVAGPATYVSGDADADGLLDPGETWTFEATYTIPIGGDDPLENNATDSGTDPLGLTVSAEDSWSVDILHPDIEIVKTAIPDTISSGDCVTYEYNVTNTGDCILYNVTVTDDKLGLIGTIPTLDVGVTTTLTKSTRLFADTTNVGMATGTDELGKGVSDWDDACVHVIISPEHPPSFAFECPCPCGCINWVRVGETKTFTFIVTNVGDHESRVYYLTLTAVIKDYTILQFVDPYTAYIKIYYNNGTFWSAYINGSLTCEKFAGFSPAGDYWMVTWRVPTTYPDGPYLEGNDGGTLLARLEISFQVKGKAGGITSLQVFPRATEDHYIDGVHLADIVDKANIWGNDLWYPVHNSYDPYDEAIGIGHSWEAGWEPLPTTDQYAHVTTSVFVWGLLNLTTTTATTEKTETKEY